MHSWSLSDDSLANDDKATDSDELRLDRGKTETQSAADRGYPKTETLDRLLRLGSQLKGVAVQEPDDAMATKTLHEDKRRSETSHRTGASPQLTSSRRAARSSNSS